VPLLATTNDMQSLLRDLAAFIADYNLVTPSGAAGIQAKCHRVLLVSGHPMRSSGPAACCAAQHGLAERVPAQW
jgi:hypothetical protein